MFGCVGCQKPKPPTPPPPVTTKERLFRAYPSSHETTACTPFLEKIQPTLLILKDNKLASFPKPKKCPRFVLLYFSASWCPPCHLFTPKLKAWYLRSHAKFPDLEVVLASLDRDWAPMEQYVHQTGMPWPILAWPNVMDSPVEKLLPEEFPYLVLVDDEGMVLMAARGMPTTLDLVEKILKVEEVK
jgi:thiol-disulfide isomerase/thioredoxin